VAAGQLQSARTNELDVAMALGFDTHFTYDGSVDFVSNQLDPNTGSIPCRAIFPNDDQSPGGGHVRADPGAGQRSAPSAARARQRGRNHAGSV